MTVDELKDVIKIEMSAELNDIAANKLALWRVSIPVATNKHRLIVLNEFETATELHSMDELFEVFNTKTLPKDSIHIIIERPKGTSTSRALELEAKIAELQKEGENLRKGLNSITLNVIMQPYCCERFSWTTDIETTTIEKFLEVIYAQYPDRQDGDAVLAIIHPRGAAQHQVGGTEHPNNNARFRNIIRLYQYTKTKTLTVALETPTKKYTDYTLNEVNTLYDISNMEEPFLSDFPRFNDISTETLDTDFHKESLRRLLDEIDSRNRALHSDTFSNVATCSAYICSFLTQAVLIFNGELRLEPDRVLRGRHGHGKIDYTIEALANDGTRHVLGVTKVKDQDFRKGLAQNLVQLESVLTKRKRERGSDNNRDEEQEENNPVPMKAYGIVTDATSWIFVECSIDPSRGSPSGDYPKFRISGLNDIINYQKSTWRVQAECVLGHIVWLIRKMLSEIPELDSK
ncbi:hypothetical protein EC991_008132 [Linnemannia zychae]|nr:hypothetical protein EC991_008132 [Linnemannia zychae]